MKKEKLEKKEFIKRYIKTSNVLEDYTDLKNVNIVTARLNGRGSNKRDKRTFLSPEEKTKVDGALTAFKNDFEGHLGDNIKNPE